MYKSRFSQRSFSGNGNNRSNNSGRGRYANKVWAVSELMRVIETEGTKPADGSSEVAEYTPKFKFEDMALSKLLLQNIVAKGYTTPTPIQDQAIPAILEGRDLIGVANTGTGKTAAFLIPLIEKAFKNKGQEKVLIVTPVRELSLQIFEEFKNFSKGMGLYAGLCIGGANIYRQRDDLRRNPAFVIGTPGRLKDLIQQGALNLSQFNNVVLDETDQMVDIGFVNEIKYFISLLPQKRQSLFFSATIPVKVYEILNAFVKNPVSISVKSRETAANIEQKVVRVERGKNKVDVLHDLLITQNCEKVLVFGKTKWGVQKLSEELSARGFRAGAIHGNKGQNQRQVVLSKFKRNEINILLATDVASRGLDIKDVSHVVNFDMPESYDNYVHRIGRTGRANKKGTAYTFVEF